MSKKDGLMLLISILLKILKKEILKKERISLSIPENGSMIKFYKVWLQKLMVQVNKLQFGDNQSRMNG